MPKCCECMYEGDYVIADHMMCKAPGGGPTSNPISRRESQIDYPCGFYKAKQGSEKKEGKSDDNKIKFKMIDDEYLYLLKDNPYFVTEEKEKIFETYKNQILSNNCMVTEYTKNGIADFCHGDIPTPLGVCYISDNAANGIIRFKQKQPLMPDLGDTKVNVINYNSSENDNEIYTIGWNLSKFRSYSEIGLNINNIKGYSINLLFLPTDYFPNLTLLVGIDDGAKNTLNKPDFLISEYNLSVTSCLHMIRLYELMLSKKIRIILFDKGKPINSHIVFIGDYTRNYMNTEIQKCWRSLKDYKDKLKNKENWAKSINQIVENFKAGGVPLTPKGKEILQRSDMYSNKSSSAPATEKKQTVSISQSKGTVTVSSSAATSSTGNNSENKQEETPENKIERYTALIRENPDNYEAFFNRGRAYPQTEQYWDKAIADFSAAIKIKPDYCEAFFQRGRYYYTKHLRYQNKPLFKLFMKNDLDRAIADYTAALKIKPEHIDALFMRGVALFIKGKNDMAIENFSAVLKIKPDDYEALKNRGDVFSKKYNYDKAIEDFNLALKINPNYSAALTSRGMAYVGKRDFARAFADWDEALKINPNDLTAKSYIQAFKSFIKPNNESGVQNKPGGVIATSNDIWWFMWDEIANSAGEITITGYKDTERVINIPEHIDFMSKKVPVVKINGFIPSNNNFSSLGAVSAEKAIHAKDIYAGIFSSHYAEEVIIPNTVREIGICAFSKNSLEKAVIPDSVKKIDICAFYNNKITKIFIPNSVKTIGADAFTGNPLKEIVIGSDVELSNYPESPSFPNGFDAFYAANSKKAGVYTNNSKGWKFQEISARKSDKTVKKEVTDSIEIRRIYSQLYNGERTVRIDIAYDLFTYENGVLIVGIKFKEGEQYSPLSYKIKQGKRCIFAAFSMEENERLGLADKLEIPFKFAVFLMKDYESKPIVTIDYAMTMEEYQELFNNWKR